MTLIEIIVIIIVVIFLSAVIGGTIYKKKNKSKSCNGNCNGCNACSLGSSLVERYRKDNPKK